jgi:hypothetical protein
MIDELNPGPAIERTGQKRPTPRSNERLVRPFADREVPLGQTPDRPLDATVHAWLDGELPEAAARKSESPKDVEFWRGLDAEMARVRRMRTPQHVEAQIMAALPTHAPAAVISPWYRREFVITPAAAALAGAALIAVAATATWLLLR